MSTPSELASLQHWFVAVVTAPDGVVDAGSDRESIDRMITRSTRLTAPDRLSVYARAYYARLIECLGNSFPALKRSLGDDLFDGFAFGYLQRYPPRSYTLGALGDRFVRYLEETRPLHEGWPELIIDLATLEAAVDDIFDGPGIEGQPTLRPEDVLAIPESRRPDLRLRTVPCLRLIRFRFPINDYYSALRRNDGPVEVAKPGPAESFLALTRRDFVVRRHDLSHGQYELLAALQQGEPIRTGIARAAAASDLDQEALAGRIREWFRQWSYREFFLGVLPAS